MAVDWLLSACAPAAELVPDDKSAGGRAFCDTSIKNNVKYCVSLATFPINWYVLNNSCADFSCQSFTICLGKSMSE